jgi:hypothetical protein
MMILDDANWTGTDDSHRAARSNLAVEHAALETGRQDVAEHHHGLFVRALGDQIETVFGVGDADVFGLSAVDLIAKNPAASRAVGVHAAAAIFAVAAR